MVRSSWQLSPWRLSPWPWVAILALVDAAVQTCWSPDGHAVPGDLPCHDGGESACCGLQSDGTSSFCLAGGFCMTDLVLGRGSCTDKTWTSPACAQVCTQLDPAGGWGLHSCGSGTTYWSCTPEDCASSNFSITAHDFRLNNTQASMYLMNTIDFSTPHVGVAVLPSTTPAVSSGKGPTIILSSITSQPTPRVGESTASLSSTTLFVPVTRSDERPTTTPSCISANEKPRENEPLISIAAVTGSILGVALIAAILLFLYERRRFNRLLRRVNQEQSHEKGPDLRIRTVPELETQTYPQELDLPPIPELDPQGVQELGQGSYNSKRRKNSIISLQIVHEPKVTSASIDPKV